MLNVTIPESETRASETNSTQGIFNNNVLGDENDNNTMRYILQIFDDAGRPSDETLIEYSDGTTVSFHVRLIPGRDYTFVVWADFVTNGETNTDNHYITKDANGKTDLRNITINEDSWVAMDETRDAFTGIFSTEAEGETYSSASTIDVELTRPFAKVRVVTTDLVALANLGIKPDYATVEYTTPYRAGFNALTCQLFEAEQNDKKTHQVSDSEAFAIVAYGDNTAANKVLFTDYLFASADQNDVVKFDLSVYEKADKSGPIKSNSFSTDIAIKRNHLTTISGNILTEGGTVNVVIDPTFGGYIEEEYPFDNTIDPNKAIYYTATSKVEPYQSNVFGANIVSNTWNESTGEGVIVFDSEVTMIGDWAFYECANIISINIPDGVTIIGTSAFYHCNRLNSINIPEGVSNVGAAAFAYCYSLKKFSGKFSAENGTCLIVDDILIAYALGCGTTECVIPSSITKIESSAFAGSTLTKIDIPESVLEIGWSAFSGNNNLSNVVIPNSVKKVGYHAFAYCHNLSNVVFPDSVDSCWDTMFSGCEKLEKFSGAYASNDGRCLMIYDYDNCTVGFAPAGLEEYTLPLNTKRVCSYFDSDVLHTLTIPASVYELCTNTFYTCGNLTSIYCRAVVPPTIEGNAKPFAENITGRKIYVPINSVDAYKSQWSLYANDIVGYDFDKEIIYYSKDKLSISSSDFNTPITSHIWNNNIGVIKFNDVVTSIGTYSFDSTSLYMISLPDTIVTIGNYAFYACYDLTDVYLGNSLSYIGIGAFFYCTGLKEINIPDSVETIDGAAFAECTNLTSVTISKNISSIGLQAFRDCDNLTEFYCKAVTPPDISWMAFSGIESDYTICVPTESIDAYKIAAGWSDYADRIVGYNFGE